MLTVAALPYTTYVMRAAYSGYDHGYDEEARSLGATPRAVLLRVHLPLVAPALAAAAFLAFLVAWSDYVVTLAARWREPGDGADPGRFARVGVRATTPPWPRCRSRPSCPRSWPWC